MANISTEPDIRVLVGNVGDASPDSGSAKLIRDNLQAAFDAKHAVKIHISLADGTLKAMRDEIEKALSDIPVGGSGGAGGSGNGGKGGGSKRGSKGAGGVGSQTPNVKFAEQQLLKLKKTWETLQASFNRSGLDSKKIGIDALDTGVQSLIAHLEQLKKSPDAVSDAMRGRIQDAVSYLASADRNTRQLDADPSLEPAQNAITIRQNLNELLGKSLSMTEELTGAERVQIQEYLKQLTTLNSSMSSYQAKTQNDQKRTNAIIDRGKKELADFDQYVRHLTPKAQLDNAGRIASIRGGLGSQDVAQIEEAEHALRDFKAEMKSLGYEGGNIFTLLQSKMKQFFVYSLSATVIGGAVKSLRSVISTVKELDAALTDLRIVSGGTKKDTEDLLRTYNRLAKSLGTTTVKVASGATDWLRQGYNEKDTEELLTQSMTLGIVGDMESADATTALTAALKGYQLQVEEASSVVDKFFQVDMEAATSSAKLAEALAKTAANAKLAGLSLDDVISQLAVVNETMQESGEETGSFYNTMLSRIGGIKAGRLEDPETGEDLSNVETTLRGLDIDLRNQAGQFRNFGEVLDEVGARWKSFSNTQQRAIATAFAGTRQQTRFLALMAGWKTAGKYAESAANSTGIAAQKLGVYQESVAAKADKAKASLEAFSMALVDSDLVGGFYDVTSFLLDIGTAGAPAITTITALTGALVGLPTIFNLIKTSGIGTAFSKTFTDLGWPEMTGDNIVPIFSEEAA